MLTKQQIAQARSLFPVTERLVWFNHAGTGPLPRTAVAAMTRVIERCGREGEVPYLEAEAAVAETRALLARLMHVEPQAVAFTKNTSAGIIIAISSIEWQAQDNVVLMQDDFPTVTQPFNYLLPQVAKRWVTSEQLVQGPDAVFRLIDKNTRAVALSWVHFLSGRRFDVAAICRFCRERGIISIVDAIQGLGVVEQDWGRVPADFVVSHGAKWLLAPQGSGFMSVSPETLPRLRPANLGWLSAQWQEFSDIFTPKPLKPGASRFEEGTKNYIGIYGLRESLKVLLGFGIANIEQRVRHLLSRLRQKVKAAGFEILTPAESGLNGGILTIRKPGADMAALQERLTSERFICARREGWLRIAPHFYNTEEEIDRFVQLLHD